MVVPMTTGTSNTVKAPWDVDFGTNPTILQHRGEMPVISQ